MSSTAEMATGGLVDADGGQWYRIDGLERMEPFLLAVASDNDLWLFASSLGPLTAGRVDADHALLPYETDDRLHRAVGRSGPVTLVTRVIEGRREVWQPFAERPGPSSTRALAKHVLGTALRLEEHHADWGLTFRTTWEPSRAFGWVRTSELVDTSATGAEVEVLDGLLDVMPAGIDSVTEQRSSNLVDAYKRSEAGLPGNVALYALESLITDRAEPAEALAATIVWATGLDGAEVHLDERVVDDTWRGGARATVELLTGRRGAYLLRAPVTVPASGSVSWLLVADTGLGHAELHDRVQVAADPEARKLVTDDVRSGAARLTSQLEGADGFQHTADAVADAHHLSNVLFNTMRGGVFADGYRLPVDDLLDFLRLRNRAVHDRFAPRLAGAGTTLLLHELTELAEATGDADLIRSVLEYLPLTFSRRHGDPSRPWNRFSIRVTKDDGSDLLSYEGNWRDIFQNWQALLRSYPRFLPHVVAKFLNASTVDGHNPYRISREGIDWEVPDPDDPWSNIGYWGDHQIVYLLHLLEDWEAVEPGVLAAWLDRPLFTYAAVPYRIAPHDAMVRDPRSTIDFDADAHARALTRVERLGADGRLLVADGDLVHVTMAEKLLVPALAKLSSYVAGGGIWMNTQRPEWNDANNALAGYGVSMVTLAQLERYLGLLLDTALADPGRPLRLSRQVAGWFDAVVAAFTEHDHEVAVSDPRVRRQLLDALGQAGSDHRAEVASGFDRTVVEVEPDEVRRGLEAALTHLRATVRAGRRRDGLYHAYNLLSFPRADAVDIHHLPPMLEGQVAVLGTRELDAAQAAELLDVLFSSPLYREDLGTFLLYPDTSRPAFLSRNEIPPALVDRHPVVQELVATGIVQQDAAGGLHFRRDLANAEVLERALSAASLDETACTSAHEVYERVFHHHAFTGRSGAMHGYEGLGSVYWHMVSKLLVAVQERHREAADDGAPDDVVERLAAAYLRVRDGLGFRKDPATFGAIPTDCYSHSPAHAGAQQPGMTGQTKEQLLVRAGELGLRVAGGTVSLVRPLLPSAELWTDLGDGDLGYRFTVCAVPVRVRAGGSPAVRLLRADGTVVERPGHALTPEEAAEVFDRRGTVTTIEFSTPR
jgi:hypothetical protein